MKRTLVILAAFVSACSPGQNFMGDGKFVAKSRWPFPNYEVLFTLSHPYTATSWHFRFSGLPQMGSTTGFKLASKSGVPCPQLKASALAAKRVVLVLRDDDQKVVASMDAALADWTWSYGGDGASGCYVYAETLYFTPHQGTKYSLDFIVDTPWLSEYIVQPQIGSYAVYAP